MECIFSDLRIVILSGILFVHKRSTLRAPLENFPKVYIYMRALRASLGIFPKVLQHIYSAFIFLQFMYDVKLNHFGFLVLLSFV